MDVGHFVNIDGVGLKLPQRVGSDHGSIVSSERKGFGEDIAPRSFGMAGGWAMQQTNRVTALFEFGGRELRIDFRARHGPEPIMNKQQSHRAAGILTSCDGRHKWGELPL